MAVTRRPCSWVTLLVLLFLCSLDLSLGGEVTHSSGDAHGDAQVAPVPDHVVIKYLGLWEESSLQTRSTPFNDDIESVQCNNDVICIESLIDVNVALSYPHLDPPDPTAPYCIYPETPSNSTGTVWGHCTCGPGKCVSYSRDLSHNGDVFYYCGTCGYVGSQCNENISCTNDLGECRGDYCECIRDGIYFDMAYCYLPNYWMEMMLEMVIASTIIIIMCSVLVCGYHRLTRNRRRAFSDSWTRNSFRCESPVDDRPPTYDDVVEKLPSYLDAVEMVAKEGDNVGITNSAFEDSSPPPPTYDESQMMTSTFITTPSQDQPHGLEGTQASSTNLEAAQTHTDNFAGARTHTANSEGAQAQTVNIEGTQACAINGGQVPQTLPAENNSTAPDPNYTNPSTVIGSQSQPIEQPLHQAMNTLSV